MQTNRAMAGIGATLALVLALLAGCDRLEPTAPAAGAETPTARQGKGPEAPSAGSKKLSVDVCAPSQGGFTTVSTNPYWPMGVGYQLVLAAEEDGEAQINQVTSLNVTVVIAGVTTRVVEEREFVGDELSEVTWNYFAQASDGSICYFGEDVDIYEEGGISHEGAWCAATPGNAPGIFMPADPKPGMKFQIEVAPEVAEDEGKIGGIGPIEVPFGRFEETIRLREFNALESAKDYKIHAAGTGIIVDGTQELEEVNQTTGVPELPTLTVQQCGV